MIAVASPTANNSRVRNTTTHKSSTCLAGCSNRPWLALLRVTCLNYGAVFFSQHSPPTPAQFHSDLCEIIRVSHRDLIKRKTTCGLDTSSRHAHLHHRKGWDGSWRGRQGWRRLVEFLGNLYTTTHSGGRTVWMARQTTPAHRLDLLRLRASTVPCLNLNDGGLLSLKMKA